MTIVYFPSYYPIRRNFFRKGRYIQEIDEHGNMMIQQVFLSRTEIERLMFTNSTMNPFLTNNSSIPSVTPNPTGAPVLLRSVPAGRKIVKTHTKTKAAVYFSTTLHRIFLCFDKETAIECVCFIFGFVYIGHSNGTSALRVLRLFRYLSYLKVSLYFVFIENL